MERGAWAGPSHTGAAKVPLSKGGNGFSFQAKAPRELKLENVRKPQKSTKCCSFKKLFSLSLKHNE